MRISFDQKWNEWEKKQAVAEAVKLEQQKKAAAVEQTAEENLAKGREEGREEGLEKGRELERQANVTSVVKTLASTGDDEASIVTKLISIFGLSKDQAEDYYHNTLNPA